MEQHKHARAAGCNNGTGNAACRMNTWLASLQGLELARMVSFGSRHFAHTRSSFQFEFFFLTASAFVYRPWC